jgi:LCP family protein required for cell wall assembly
MTIRLRWVRRLVTLGVVLAAAAVVVPDSAVKPTQLELVKIQRATGVDYPAGDKEVVWILAVGSDARPGQAMTSTRGDALQLVGMDLRTGAATAIGIPRDSWVPIPGHGSDKINAALFYGGPQALAGAVGNLVGIQPDYVLVSRFRYFQALIGSIGGIEVDNPRAFSDPNLKPDGFREGRIHLGPYDAMVFSRIRYNLVRGDFDRSANQQRVLRGIQAKVRARAHEKGFIENGVMHALQYLRTDLKPGELFQLAQAMAQVDPAKITNCVVQGGIGNIGGASVVLPFVDQARRFGDRARNDATLESCD